MWLGAKVVVRERMFSDALGYIALGSCIIRKINPIDKENREDFFLKRKLNKYPFSEI